jgi:hypothetical protein
MKKEKLQTGIYARTPKGFDKNVKHMEQEGYSKRRAVGAAYGEAHKDMGMMDYDKLMNRVKKC